MKVGSPKMNSRTDDSRLRSFPASLLPWLILVLSLTATWALWSYSREQTHEALREYFDFRVRQAATLTEQRILAQNQVLRGAQGLFIASHTVSRQEFRDYVATLKLDENYPGIQGVGLSLIIRPDDLQNHIARIRKETGHLEYTVWPKAARAIYTSVVYLEPFYGRNLRAFGFDMFSESVRHDAMVRARDSGIASMSGKVSLVQETDKAPQAGFLIYLPLYKPDAPQGTLEERRQNIIGWVYSPFRMDDLAHGMYGERANDLDIEIYDGTTLSPATLMYDSNRNHDYRKSAFSRTTELNFGGHTWTLLMYSMPLLESHFGNHQSLTIAISGVTLSLLFYALAWTLMNERRRALALAQQMTADLRIENQKNLALLHNASDGIHILDINGNVIEVSDSFCSMLGYTREEILGMNFHQWDVGIKEPDLTRVFKEQFDHPKRSQFETQHLRKDGTIIDVEVSGRPLELNGQKLVFNSARDISDRKKLEAQIRQLAFYDPLTKLPNRRLLSDRLEQAMAASKRGHFFGAVMFLDLDNFKPLNDAYGHDTGDLLLIEVANRLKSCLRNIDTVARLGGDEFLVVLYELNQDKAHSISQARNVAEKIRAALAKPYQLSALEGSGTDEAVVHQCSVSIGITVYQGNTVSKEELLKQADRAMYQAKDSGRDQICFSETGC